MQGGFSIREYTSGMRSVNVVNCWPFDETFGEETMKSLLPPIVVKRFTWWLDELRLLHSETAEKLEISERKTGKVLEKGETSSRNADRDLEGAEEGVKVVKYKSVKGKLRATKKRSIVEIFAVAPPVKRAIRGEVETEEEEEDTSCNSTSRYVRINRARKNKRNKKMKNTDVILRKALRVVKKINRKKAAEERRGSKEIGVPDKENCFKIKPHSQEKASGNSSSSCSKESEDDIHDCVSNPKREPRLQDLGPYRKFGACKAFKLIGESQHPELPVRGILKNQGTEFSIKKSNKCLWQKEVQLNDCSPQKENKHVTFSENGELLRLSKRSSQSEECYKLGKDCGFGVGSIDRAVAVGKDSTSSESSGSEGASARVGKDIGAGPASNEQLAMFRVDSTTLGKQNYEWEHSTRSGSSERSAMYRVNQHWSDHDLRDAPHNTMDVCPELLHMPRDSYYNSQNVKLITTSSNTTCRRLSKEDVEAPCSVLPPLCFKDYLRTYNDASMSHPSNMKRTYKQSQASSENTAINCAHSIHFQAFPHLSPNELLDSFCFLPDGSQTGDIGGRNTNRISEDFMGLPLNSQGELITLNSSAKRDVKRMMNSNMSAAHCIDLSLPSNGVSKCLGHHSEYRNLDNRASSRRQLNLFPVESYVKENAAPVTPSRLGIIESQSVKANLDLDFPEVNYHPFRNYEKTSCQGDNQAQKGPENAKCQSTMRLMGKEFEVGGRGVQGFEDGRMWKDKQIIDELHFQNEPSFRDLSETLFCPSEVTVNHRSQSKYALPHIDRQTSSTYKSVFLTRTVSCAQKCYPSLPPGTYSEVYDNKSLFSEPFTTGHNSQLFIPKASAPCQELCSNMSPSDIQLKNKQNLHYSSISSIKFPFMHPDLDGHANSSWAQRSSRIQQPLCFDVSEKATRMSNIQSCTLGCNHPYPKSGIIHRMNSSVSFQPDDFCMFSPLQSGSALQSIAPAALTPLAYYPGVLPVSAMQRNHRNQSKIKERIKSRIGIRDLNICKKPKGHPSALSNAYFKPLKRPTIGFHEGLQCAVRKPAACVSFETKKEGQTQTISPFVDPFIETARTGPIKLTAGSKHILKACQQKDQDVGFRFS